MTCCNPLTALYVGHHDANQQEQPKAPVSAHLPTGTTTPRPPHYAVEEATPVAATRMQLARSYPT